MSKHFAMTRRLLPHRPGRPFVAGLIQALGLAALAATATAQDAAPRSARLEPVEGSVAFAPAGEREWLDTRRGRNLQRGDRLWVDPRSRAEVQVGRDLLRMEGPAHLHLAELTTRSTQLNLTQGTLQARVRTPLDTHHFDLNTPNLAFRAAQPGEYRIDVDRARGFTRVLVLSGRGTVYGAGGQQLAINEGQQIAFAGTTLARQGDGPAVRNDGFGRWAAGREEQLASRPAARMPTAESGGSRESAAAPARPGATAARSTSPRFEQGTAPRPDAERARREAWHREQAALSDQWKRDHADYQQRGAARTAQGVQIERQVTPVARRP